MLKLGTVKRLPLIFILITMLFALSLRIAMFGEAGSDFGVYIKALFTFTAGGNPYVDTIASFSNPGEISDHGFSYLPGFLYLYLPFYLITNTLQLFTIFSKIPLLLADIGICIILFRELSKHSKWAAFLGIFVWLFNPYFVAQKNFIYMDSVPVFFMLLALFYLDRSVVVSAVSYAISCIFKTFPVLLLPLFLVRTKNRLQFLLWAGVYLLIVSWPFLYDPLTYLKGTLFVHSDRPMQGKPFLYTLSYLYKIEIIRVIPLPLYTYLATFGGWVIIIFNEFLNRVNKGLKFESKYIYSFLSFFVFYLFTPVLNRTYLLWVLPIVVLASFDLVKEKKYPGWVSYGLTAGFYMFYLFYLSIWGRGLHVDYQYY